ncbi:MAG: hypothetical protein R3F14_38415 [Polyangiaceae bacterium]
MTALDAMARVRWSVPLKNAAGLRAPVVVCDDAGAVYVVGPYQQEGEALRGCPSVSITKLGARGTPEWRRLLASVPVHEGRLLVPIVRAAPVPGGGAVLTWVGRRAERNVVRALRFSTEGSLEWAIAWECEADAWDPRVGVDAEGACAFWGSFQGGLAAGAIRLDSGPCEARYVVRVTSKGRITWAESFRPIAGEPWAVALARDGTLGVVTRIRTPKTEARPLVDAVALVPFDPNGHPRKNVVGKCEPHTAIPSLIVAPVSSDSFAVAGYISGGARFGRRALPVRSVTPGAESVYLVGVDGAGETWARTLSTPQLFGGLSVHGGAERTTLLAGWASGTMSFGGAKITSPPRGAVLFLAGMRKAREGEGEGNEEGGSQGDRQ